MALDTFSNLKASVVSFSGRDDLSEHMDDFVKLTEQSIYHNDQSPLKIRSMEALSTLVTVAGTKTVDLPANFLAFRSITIESGGNEYPLSYYTPGALPTPNTSGVPRAFTITDKIEFDYNPDAVYTININYYAKATPLSSAAPTNAILTTYPSIYLYGCLACVYDFANEPELSEYNYGKFIRAIKGAIRGDHKGSPTPQARVYGSHP